MGGRGTRQACLGLRWTQAGVRPSPQVEWLKRRSRIPEGPEGHRKPQGIPSVRLRSSPRYYREALWSVRGRASPGTGRAPPGAACDSRDSAGWAKRGNKDRGDKEGDPVLTGVPLKVSGCLLRSTLSCPPIEAPSALVAALLRLPAHLCCHLHRAQTTMCPPRC